MSCRDQAQLTCFRTRRRQTKLRVSAPWRGERVIKRRKSQLQVQGYIAFQEELEPRPIRGPENRGLALDELPVSAQSAQSDTHDWPSGSTRCKAQAASSTSRRRKVVSCLPKPADSVALPSNRHHDRAPAIPVPTVSQPPIRFPLCPVPIS
jgi:hypothetical protein